MEYIEYFKYKFRRKDCEERNLVEVYTIKERYINETFVLDFLKARKKSIEGNRYKIEIVTDRTSEEEETVGTVELMRKNKLIERARLITKTDVPKNERLIYWKFQ